MVSWTNNQGGGRDSFEEAKALYESGIYISRDNPLSAIAHFVQAASVFSELKGQKKKRDKSLWQAGVCYGRVGWNAKKRRDWDGARDAFREALRIFVTIRDQEKEATTLYQLSLISCDVLTTSDLLKKAALIYADLNRDEKEAMCLAELGNLFTKRDVGTSLFHWRQALVLYMKIGDKEKEARALYSIGETLLRTDRTAAYNHFLQARVVFRALMNRPKCDGDCSYQLGKICVGSKSFEAAVQFFEEASTLFRQVEAKTDEAWALYRLALVMLKVRSKELAVDYLTEARRLFAEVENERQAEGSCLLRLAEIEKDFDPPLAKALLEEALEFVDPRKERIGRRSTMIWNELQTKEVFGNGRLVPLPEEDETEDQGERVEGLSAVREEEEEEEENWSFAGATEEGGSRENVRTVDREEEGGQDEGEREGRIRESSEGGEGAWWAI